MVCATLVGAEGAADARPADLTFPQRVEAQRAIERVYYAHQIGASASFDAAVPRRVLEAKVRRYLKQSATLEEERGIKITPELLREEQDRISRNTAFPDRLEEIYQALGRDPVLIRECFVRPVLVERLTVGRPTASMAATLESGLAAGASPWCPGQDDHWRSTGTIGAPIGRSGHTAVWTGNVMIVWGGYRDGGATLFDSGGRYDLLTDSWSPTSITGAPVARVFHSAVWTGQYMVVWGGTYGGEPYLDSGGRYDPASDTWLPTTTTGGPEGRLGHAAVWTGTRMLIWGGEVAPPDGIFPPRTVHSYDPQADSWQTRSESGAPSDRSFLSAVWTGREMVVWGGYSSTPSGGRYDAAADRWRPTSLTNAPQGRYEHSAIWTGTRMIVWGGKDQSGGIFDTGGVYDPNGDVWGPTAALNAPSARWWHSGVWTGTEMIVWGGLTGGGFVNTGARYDPESGSWSATSTLEALSARGNHSAIWTGAGMIVWGGSDQSTGGTYFIGPPPPPEVANLRWPDGSTLAWDACPGGAAFYDLMYGPLDQVAGVGSLAGEVCLADERSGTQMPDSSPPPPGGAGWYFLVRASTPAGPGPWGYTSSGSERYTSVCP